MTRGGARSSLKASIIPRAHKCRTPLRVKMYRCSHETSHEMSDDVQLHARHRAVRKCSDQA